MSFDRFGHKEFGHVMANAPCPHHRDGFACGAGAGEDLGLGRDAGMVDAPQLGNTRCDSGGNNHMVKTVEIVQPGTLSKAQFDAVLLQLAAIIAQGLVKLILARCCLRQIQLTAQLVLRFEQGNVVAQ